MNHSKRTLIACSAALMMLAFTVSANASVTLVSPKNSQHADIVSENTGKPLTGLTRANVKPSPDAAVLTQAKPIGLPQRFVGAVKASRYKP